MKKSFINCLCIGIVSTLLVSCGGTITKVENGEEVSETVDVDENSVNKVEASEKSETISINKNDNKIYTTIYPIQFILERLVGDFVTIESVIPSGGDPHLFEISQQDLVDVAESDMYIYLSSEVELNSEEVGKALENEKVEVLGLWDKLGIEEEHDHAHEHTEEIEEHTEEAEEEHDHEHGNIHIWADPMYVLDMAVVIHEELIAIYPELEDIIEDNFEILEADLIALDNKFKTEIADADNFFDFFVVSHDKFAHWEKYGISSIAVKDEAHSKDPTSQELETIIETINVNGIKYVVFERNVPCMPLDVIKSETNTEKAILSDGGVRSQTEIDEGKDYIEIMEENIETLKIILNEHN